MKKLKKGKKNHQGEGGGRPGSFQSEEDFYSKVLAYLDDCKEKMEMPNRAGLCDFLNIHRDTYYDYRSKGKYSDSIKRFEQRSESKWVQRLGGNSPTGAIFYLKNAFKEDFKDRNETKTN